MTDLDIVKALISRNETVTRQFFFKDCRPLFLSIMRHVFSYTVDYDEFVNEFYLYLMENNAHRLRQFEGRSTLYQWLKVVAIHYFIAKRSRMIDSNTKTSLYKVPPPGAHDNERSTYRLDTKLLLDKMTNKRYADIIKRLVLDDAKPEVVAREFGITTANLYNIKKRAITELTAIALEDVRIYEKTYIQTIV